MGIKGLSKRHWPAIAIGLLLIAAAAILSASDIRYYVNPDATSYFSIAEKYAHWHLHPAINGYWGPLLSWLLVPFVWLHVDLAVAARVLSAILGAAAGLLSYLFLLKRGASRRIATAVATMVALTIVNSAVFGPITPDILLAFLLFSLTYVIASWLDSPSPRRAVLVGTIGALMYYAKSIGLFFFIGVLVISGLWLWKGMKKSSWSIAKLFWPVVTTTIVLLLPFVVLISEKYHGLTINTAFAYNHRVYGPTQKGVHPNSYLGPIAPHSTLDSNAWEDPTYMAPLMPNWGMTGSWKNFKFFYTSFATNLNNSLAYIRQPALAGLGSFLLLLGCFQKRYRKEFVLLSAAALLVVVGYSLIYVEPRYLAAVPILAVTALGLWLAGLDKKGVISSGEYWVGIAIAFFVALFSIYQADNAAYKTTVQDWRQLHSRAISIQKFLPAGANIITDHDNYYTCYYLKLRCYGVLETLPSGYNPDNYYRWLKDEGVAYYVDYHNRDYDQQLHSFISAYYLKIGESVTAEGTRTTVYALR